jgi:hypothetical protein
VKVLSWSRNCPPLWNTSFNYIVQKSPPLDFVLNHLNSVKNLITHIFNNLINITLYISVDPPSGVFTSGFPTKILYAFLMFPFVLQAQQRHPSSYHHPNNIWWRYPPDTPSLLGQLRWICLLCTFNVHVSSRIHFSLFRSCQRIRPISSPFVTFCTTLVAYSWLLLVPCRTPKLKNHPLLSVRDCLLNIFWDTLHIWSPSPPFANRGCRRLWW